MRPPGGSAPRGMKKGSRRGKLREAAKPEAGVILLPESASVNLVRMRFRTEGLRSCRKVGRPRRKVGFFRSNRAGGRRRDYFDLLNPNRAARRLTSRLQKIGFVVTLTRIRPALPIAEAPWSGGPEEPIKRKRGRPRKYLRSEDLKPMASEV